MKWTVGRTRGTPTESAGEATMQEEPEPLHWSKEEKLTRHLIFQNLEAIFSKIESDLY